MSQHHMKKIHMTIEQGLLDRKTLKHALGDFDIRGGGFAETTFFLIVSSSIPWFLFFQPMVKWSNPLLMFGKKEKPKVRIEC